MDITHVLKNIFVLVDDQKFQQICDKQLNQRFTEFDINNLYSLLLYNPLITLGSSRESYGNPIMSNVAVASAITSYSRIRINPYLINRSNLCFYSDTDSLFLQYPLNDSLVGTQLGQFKDELNGDFITEAFFIKPKCYGFETNSGASTHKVVIAGFPSNR